MRAESRGSEVRRWLLAKPPAAMLTNINRCRRLSNEAEASVLSVMQEFSNPHRDSKNKDHGANDAERPLGDGSESDEDDAEGGHRRRIAGHGKRGWTRRVPARSVLGQQLLVFFKPIWEREARTAREALR